MGGSYPILGMMELFVRFSGYVSRIKSIAHLGTEVTSPLIMFKEGPLESNTLVGRLYL